MNALRHLSVRHWGWINFKLALMFWAIALLETAPPSLLATLGWVVYLIAIATISGAGISLVGLVMSAQRGAMAVLGLTVELIGISLMLVGPFGYFATSCLLAITGYNGLKGGVFLPTVFVSYALVAALVNRILIVAPKRRREGHDPGKRG